MKKVLVALTLAMVVPMASQAGTADQHVSGTAALPTKWVTGPAGDPPQGPTDSAYPGVQRRVDIVTMGLGNGAFGYVFPVNQDTWCNEFTVTLTGSGGTTPDDPNPDVDIYFYSGWDDIVAGEVPSAYAYETHGGNGGEHGFVPPDTTRAMVFSYNTINAAFTYDSVANDLDPEAEVCVDALPTPQ